MTKAKIIEDELELAAIVRGARKVAVVGMRDAHEPDAPAYRIPRILEARGLALFAVNPKLDGAYPDLGKVPEEVDIVDIFRRPDAIGAVADEVLAIPEERRPAVVWLQQGIRNDEAAARLVAGGVDVVQDKCLGVYSERYRDLKI
jgi:uncharacterized protein